MAQHSQASPSITAHIDGATRQVNLRDYLNVRIYPFLKKAITESLEASPDFPLQWLGENLIHQSMLYEGNPDSTNIKERFLYQFDLPVSASPVHNGLEETPIQPQPTSTVGDLPEQPVPATNGTPAQESAPADNAPVVNHTSMTEMVPQDGEGNDSRDTEMEGTS